MEEELEEYVKANEGATNMIEELLPKAAGLEAEKQQIEKEIPTLLKGITSAEEQKEKAQKQMDTINEVKVQWSRLVCSKINILDFLGNSKT